jgi:hypothetical protein
MMEVPDPAQVAKRRAIETGTACAYSYLNIAFNTATPSNRKANFLYQAVEMAARATLTSWGRPMAGLKVWTAFFDRLSAHLPSEVVAWAHEVNLKSSECVQALLVPAAHHVSAIIALSMDDPPKSFGARSSPLQWNELNPEDRALLHDAANRATVFAPGSELWLFGSRATGEDRDDSDYDVRLVVPDDTPDKLRHLAQAELWQAAKDRGARIDHAFIARSAFDAPNLGEDVLLVYEIKQYGVPVPPVLDETDHPSV